MNRRANPALVGAFILASVAIAIAAIVVLGVGTIFQQTTEHVLYFDGSLSGLDIGAPVEFRGVRVGSVKDVTLVYDCAQNAYRIPVRVELEPNRVCYVGTGANNIAGLIERGLRAQIQSQSILTGKLKIMLVERPEAAATLVGGDSDAHEIPTIPRTTDEVFRTFEELPIIEIVNRLHETVSLIAKLAESEKTAAFLGSTSDLVEQLDTTLVSLNAVLTETRPVVTNMASMMPEMMAVLNSSSAGLLDTMTQMNATLADVRKALSARSPVRYEAENAVREISAAAESLRVLLDYLQQHPESLLRGKRTDKEMWK